MSWAGRRALPQRSCSSSEQGAGEISATGILFGEDAQTAREGKYLLRRPAGRLVVDLSGLLEVPALVPLNPKEFPLPVQNPLERVAVVRGKRVEGVLKATQMALHLTPEQLNEENAARMKHCVGNLRFLEAAKEQWALDHRKDVGSSLTFQDLQKDGAYISRQPRWPGSGSFSFSLSFSLSARGSGG